MSAWHRIVDWWRRPPVRDRILLELLEVEQQVGNHAGRLPGRDLARRLDVWNIYGYLHRLEDDGLVMSIVDPDLTVYMSTGAGLQRRRYWLTEAGRDRAIVIGEPRP